MNNRDFETTIKLTPEDNHRLASLTGECHSLIKQIEQHYGTHIISRGFSFTIQGTKDAVEKSVQAIETLYGQTKTAKHLSGDAVHLVLCETDSQNNQPTSQTTIKTPRKTIISRSANQLQYVSCIELNDVVFGIGPAGTGKTFLAVAMAVKALMNEDVARLILVRPAVEAGEQLGFLPGDMSQKIDPYLRPLYDALHELLGGEQVNKLIERDVIQIAPLAYMRGRTLNHAFVILDEGQNTTIDQMKMFLTRLGFGSKAVITGDVTQVDLPSHKLSGLRHAARILTNEEGIAICHFDAKDVVRHPLVARIIKAYEKETSDSAYSLRNIQSNTDDH